MILKSEKNPEYQLQIEKGQALLTIEGVSVLGSKHLLKVEFYNMKYQVESLLLSGLKDDEKVSTAKLLRFLVEIGFIFSPASFRNALTKNLSLEERFRCERFRTKIDYVSFQNNKNILTFHTDFVRNISDNIMEHKFVQLSYDSIEKQISLVFCGEPKTDSEKPKGSYVYKLTFHPDFCQMQVTCTGFLTHHNLNLNGRYSIRLSEENKECSEENREWIISI